MAIITPEELSSSGIDIAAIVEKIGPQKVKNNKDGSVEIEGYELDDIIKLARYLSSKRSKRSRFGSIASARIIPSDSRGRHNEC